MRIPDKNSRIEKTLFVEQIKFKSKNLYLSLTNDIENVEFY